MRLARIRRGDLVVVDDGRPYYAIALERTGRRLRVRPIASHHAPRPVTARDVVAHFKLAQGADPLAPHSDERAAANELYPTRGRDVLAVSAPTSTAR
jgi:hypothetical protein